MKTWEELHQIKMLGEVNIEEDIDVSKMAAIILAEVIAKNPIVMHLFIAATNPDKDIDELNEILERINKTTKLAQYIDMLLDEEVIETLASNCSIPEMFKK